MDLQDLSEERPHIGPTQIEASFDAQAGSLKGGDPAAGSPTATLLRLHPSR